MDSIRSVIGPHLRHLLPLSVTLYTILNTAGPLSSDYYTHPVLHSPNPQSGGRSRVPCRVRAFLSLKYLMVGAALTHSGSPQAKQVSLSHHTYAGLKTTEPNIEKSSFKVLCTTLN
ncbi:hypothetical protein NQD34_013684 [Periophthalmus magnuspinnatus]|nr:hypothetical protein NQD34_013684 [Periophthalmus magnuspinnatus]